MKGLVLELFLAANRSAPSEAFIPPPPSRLTVEEEADRSGVRSGGKRATPF